MAATSDGCALRFSLEPLVEPSTPDPRAILTKAEEVNFLSGHGVNSSTTV